MNAITIKNLVKKYGNKTAVNGISLDIKKGELFGLLGVNGAGKTTVIKMLSGLLTPTDGDALVMESSIVTKIDDVRKVIAVSPQETSVAPNLTVRENLEFMSRIYGNNKKQSKEKASEMISICSLAECENSKAKTLSGGFNRRLSIAMALISNPHIIFLDEPTLGLDVLARRELWSVIEGLKGNTTVVLTTHYLEEAEALCDRIAVMVSGDIRAVGTADELKKITQKNTLEDAFVAIAKGEYSV